MLNPYIGITDFTSGSQVRAMQEVFKAHLPEGSKRVLHVGVMMSRKTLKDLPTKWAEAFPPKDKVGRIFFAGVGTYNCLHYADYDHSHNVWSDIAEALRWTGSSVSAIQLDMKWPNPEDVAYGVCACPKGFEVILQIGPPALKFLRHDPKRVVRKLGDYDGIIRRVLLDESAGTGREMNVEALLVFARAIRDAYPNLGIGMAGGLGPETLRFVEPALEEFPDLSFDAQSRLRPSGSALDPVDWGMAGLYLKRALKLTEKYER